MIGPELSLESKKILLTGGAGFLGSHLVEKLAGCDLIVVDDFSTTKVNYLPPQTKLIKTKAENFESDERFDIIVHMAARPSPDDYIVHPVETMLSNSTGTLKLLEMARKSDCQIMYTSTSEIYGSAETIPTPETYWGYVNSVGPRSCYDESKRFSEALLMSYHRQYGLDVRIERIFNVYGPRLRADGTYGRVVSRFITQALEGKDITIHGDGMQTRSFLYADDWVDATIRFLASKGLSGEVMNIGSDREVTVLELANMILSLSNSQSKIKFESARPDDPRRRAADNSKAKALLGWQPKVTLKDGLGKTINWFKGNL